MLVLRLFGLLVMAAAFVAFIVDGVKTIASNAITVTPFGEAWERFHAPSLNALKSLVEGTGYPVLWDPLLLSILASPSWLILFFLGLFLQWLGRRREAPSIIVNER